MSSANVFNPRKPLFWLVGVAAAAAFFASGALVARATDDDDDADRAQVVLPGISAGEGTGNAPAVFPGTIVKDGGAPRSADASYPGCRAPLPAGVVTATGFDPAKAGFIAAMPGSGFAAISISFSAMGECDKDGNAISGDLQLDTSWRHTATGLDAYVSQRVSAERVASLIRQDSATFWTNGYVFNVGVNAYRVLPVAEDAIPAPSSGSGSASAGPGGSTATTVAPIPPTADPRAAEVLREIIGQLSPSTDLKCFWKAGPGDWGSLAQLGIGDPRPAIPAGFTQQELNVTAFTAPDAPCDTSVKPVEGFSFNAGWQKQDSNGFAYIGVSVYNNGSTEDYPGNISEYGANWSRNGLQFGVYAKSEKPLGMDLVRSIAKALDPQFNEACFIQQRELNESELAALGFSAAKAPADYKLERKSLSASEIAAGCAKPNGFQPTYSLSWTFTKGADVINAGANRFGSEVTGNGSGFRTPNNLNWSSANGTQFYVNASSSGINPTVPLDDLVSVAKSMDASFDLSKLTEQPGGGEKPLPADRPSR